MTANEEDRLGINSGSFSGCINNDNYPSLVSRENSVPRDESDNNEDEIIKLNRSFNIDLLQFNNIQLSHFDNSLTILNVNLRSLNSNFTLFKAFLSQLRASIKVIIITETHTDDESAKLYNLNGYKKAFISRNKFGGGLMSFIHHSLYFNVNCKYTVMNSAYETLFHV